MASALRKAQTHDDQVHGSLKMKVTILASEWRSSNGGLSTINRELAIQLAKFPEVEITLFLPKCCREDKKVALDHKVKIVEATPLSGFEQLDWLCFPPENLQIDIVVGHGVKLGKQAQVIKKSKTCKWVQVVHTDPEELGMFKNYPNPISKGEEKHKIEVELCEMADHVVGVGPKLSEAFRSYLCGCHKDGKVFDLTPGVFEEFDTVKQVSPSDRQQRRVLVFGRGDAEDFELKGFDIAGKAIAALQDTVLVFVGAPDGKHEEIANRLIECGVPASRLRVRGFVQDRESLKRLFQEVDLVVMPSRTEGFGLTGLEAMSAGLPVLVSRNSGFGEALRSAAFGSSFVIDSEVPAIWTVAIQNILSKDRECRLEEAVTLRDSYGRKYNWAKQIKELVDKMICLTHATEDSRKARSSFETKCNASQRMESMTEDHEGTSSEDSGVFFKKQMPSKIASHEDASSLGKEPLNSWSMQNIAGSTSNIGVVSAFVRLLISLNTQDLSDEQQEIIVKDLEHRVHVYQKFHDVSTPDSIRAFTEYLEKAFNVAILMVESGSLIITVQCPNLESLESLWNDYQSGHLNDIAETFLVTDELKRKLGMQNIRLKTTIEEENYLICKKAFMEISGIATNTETSSQAVDSGQVEDPRLDGTKSEILKDKKQVLTPLARAEKAKASRGPLHKAAICGQYETIKMLLESGEDVDQRDQFSLTPLHLACWYGQESVVKLLLEHGANVNAEDRFQRTPLQKAERQNQHSIVQLLQKNDARPSLHQPVSLRNLSRKAFLRVDEQSGFNLLQAAVFEGEYDIVSKAAGLLDNFVKEMELRKTGNNAKHFPGKTAVDILSLMERKELNHYHIEEFYEECAEDNRLTKLQWATCIDDAELAVEHVLNDNVDINARASDNESTALFSASRSSSSQFIEILIDLGADVNAQREEPTFLMSQWLYKAPLMLAAVWNNYMAACLLLRHAAGVNVQNSSGSTPLHLSVGKNYESLVRLFLERNADVHTQDRSGHTPLHLAVLSSNENLVRLFLEHNADVNAQDRNGYTPLHQAVESGNENLVRLFLELNADVNAQDRNRYTPRHLAVLSGNENLVRLFLELNADVNTQDRNGYTPLHEAVISRKENLVRLFLELNADVNAQDRNGYTPLHKAVKSGNENLVRLFLEHNADVNIEDSGGHTLLHQAVISRNENLVRLFLELNGDVNAQDRNGITPLHQAVKSGNENLVRLFLERNARVNTQDMDGYTPLQEAVISGNENLVRLFLENHADVNIQNTYGETSLLLSIKNGHEKLFTLLAENSADVDISDNDGYTLLHWYVMGGDKNLIRFLVEHNVDVNVQNKDGYTPLHQLVFKNDENRCRLLLEHKAEVKINAQDVNGYTPLHRAVMNGAVNLIELLLQHKADVNIQHKFGFTPLHLSARFSHKDCNKIIDLLLQYGVQNIDIRDVEGRTPLQMAVRCGNAQAVKKLVDLGADVSLVKADKKDAVELERLYYEAENVE